MDSLKKRLGARIQKLRRAQKMTQERLAETIDLDTPNLSNIECGRRFMTAETLEKIAAALHLPIHELFNFENPLSLKDGIDEKLKLLTEKELQFVYRTINNIIELR